MTVKAAVPDQWLVRYTVVHCGLTYTVWYFCTFPLFCPIRPETLPNTHLPYPVRADRQTVHLPYTVDRYASYEITGQSVGSGQAWPKTVGYSSWPKSIRGSWDRSARSAGPVHYWLFTLLGTSLAFRLALTGLSGLAQAHHPKRCQPMAPPRPAQTVEDLLAEVPTWPPPVLCPCGTPPIVHTCCTPWVHRARWPLPLTAVLHAVHRSHAQPTVRRCASSDICSLRTIVRQSLRASTVRTTIRTLTVRTPKETS